MTELERIAKLEFNMETVLRHEKKFNDSIDLLEMASADLKLTTTLISEQFKEIPSRVRKLEDKSIVTEIIKTGGWVILGFILSAFFQNQFIATKEKKYYSIQKNKE